MSIQRDERSPSFRMRMPTAKVNHHSKLLPVDFFPKSASQSPKKRSQPPPPTSANILEEWYDRDESNEKKKNTFNRMSYQKDNNKRIDRYQPPICNPSKEKVKQFAQAYNNIKEHLIKKIVLEAYFGERQRKTVVIEHPVNIIRSPSLIKQISQQKRESALTSLTKCRVRRNISGDRLRKQPKPKIERVSLKELPSSSEKPQTRQEAAPVEFNALMTFNPLKNLLKKNFK